MHRYGRCWNCRICPGKQYVWLDNITETLTDMLSAFPMAVFLIYGAHWGSLAYTQDPIHQTISAFAELGGANGAAYNASQGFHNITM